MNFRIISFRSLLKTKFKPLRNSSSHFISQTWTRLKSFNSNYSRRSFSLLSFPSRNTFSAKHSIFLFAPSRIRFFCSTNQEANEVPNFTVPNPPVQMERTQSYNQTFAQEMFQEAEDLISEKKFRNAEFVLLGALELCQSVAVSKLSSKLKLNLAFVYHNLNENDKAIHFYKEALTDMKSTFGSDSIEFGFTLSSYSEVLFNNKQTEEAIKLCRQAFQVLEKACGPEDLKTGLVLSNLAGFLMEANNPTEAKPICQKALTILIQTLGRENSFTIACYRNLKTIAEALEQGSSAKIEAEWKEGTERENSEIETFAKEDAIQSKEQILDAQTLEAWKNTKKIKDCDVPGVYFEDKNLLEKQQSAFKKFYEEKGRQVNFEEV